MENLSYKNRLEAFNLDPDFIRWAGDKSLSEIYNQCKEPKWLIRLVGKLKVDRKIFVRIACQCARLTLHLIPFGEDRPRIAIETTELWLDGKATIEQVNNDANDAYYAANDAAYAAGAAAYAANAGVAYYPYYDVVVDAAGELGMKEKCLEIVKNNISLNLLMELECGIAIESDWLK